MSLILTHLSKFGIIHASDSNLTSGSNTPAGQARKTFAVPYLNAGLTVAGVFTVAKQRMDNWLDAFIAAQQAAGVGSLKDFAETLKANIETQMHSDEKHCGSMLHIAGYVEHSGWYHPEFYFIRNAHGIDSATGAYMDIRDDFAISEDFWSRDCKNNNLMARFQSGQYLIYINGYPQGRIGYLSAQQHLNQFFETMWAQQGPGWKFRPPRSLQETVRIVEVYMGVITTLFEVSDYPAPYIGGTTQLCQIPQPPKTALTP